MAYASAKSSLIVSKKAPQILRGHILHYFRIIVPQFIRLKLKAEWVKFHFQNHRERINAGNQPKTRFCRRALITGIYIQHFVLA